MNPRYHCDPVTREPFRRSIRDFEPRYREPFKFEAPTIPEIKLELPPKLEIKLEPAPPLSLNKISDSFAPKRFNWDKKW